MLNIKMNAIPCYYEAAKELEKSYLEHTALAISQNLGGIAVFKEDYCCCIEQK
jgi:hypothetical protein